MPLYKSITVDNDTNLLIWKITESFEMLQQNITLGSTSQQRLDSMKSKIHQRGFVSIRQLLSIIGYEDADLVYDAFGKPHLPDGKYISITHSYEFSAIIISNHPVGVDIEMQRDKIIRIASKFVGLENEYLTETDQTKMLSVIWTAKESLYKLYATPGLSFLEHIYIHPFTMEMPFTTATVTYKSESQQFQISFMEFEGFICAYAEPNTFP